MCLAAGVSMDANIQGKKAVVVVRDCVGIAKLKFTELSDVQRSANVARRVAGHGIDQ